MSRRRIRRPQPTTDQRTPEQRLEAMVREPNPERSQRILARILDDLDLAPDPCPWLSAARVLNERLIISDDALYFFAEVFTECVILSASADDPEFARIGSAMIGIEKEHGLRKDETWYVDEAPAEWQALNEEWDRHADALAVACLRKCGHADLADVREKKPREFEERGRRGRIELWGEDEELD